MGAVNQSKIRLEFSGFNEILKKLAKAEADVKPIAEKALKESFDIVTERAEAAAVPQNYPQGGKYSRKTPPNTASSLRKNFTVEWNGTVGTAPVGFDTTKGGMPSIFLIRGTPRMAKVQAMYDAFYSEQIIGEVLAAQRRIFYKAMEELE